MPIDPNRVVLRFSAFELECLLAAAVQENLTRDQLVVRYLDDVADGKVEPPASVVRLPTGEVVPLALNRDQKRTEMVSVNLNPKFPRGSDARSSNGPTNLDAANALAARVGMPLSELVRYAAGQILVEDAVRRLMTDMEKELNAARREAARLHGLLTALQNQYSL
jgi:hypothetical protein